MKVLNSLKSAKTRDKNCRVVRRKGRVFVINKKNPRFKARQAGKGAPQRCSWNPIQPRLPEQSGARFFVALFIS